MEQKQFFVNISSVDSLQFFPFNSSTDFTNKLNSSIPLNSDYEVALASIIYTGKPVDATHRRLVLDSETKIMINYPSATTFTETFTRADYYLGVNRVINLVTEHLKKLKYAHIVTEADANNNVSVKLYVYTPGKGRVVLDENVALMLGFSKDKTTFENGIHEAENPFNIEILSSLILTVQYTVIKFVNIFAVIPDLADESLDSIAEALNTSFETVGVKITAKADASEEYLNFTFPDDLVSFYLPTKLSNFFGCSPEQLYSKANAQVDATTMKTEEFCNQFLVLSNIVDLQHYGSKVLPILRIVPTASSIKGPTWVNFTPLFYMPVTKKELSEIQIQLKSINAQDIPIDEGTVTVTLHFREKNEGSKL